MQPVLAAAGCFVLYFLVYRFYARYLGRQIFKLDPTVKTPAHTMNDGCDYVPCRKPVLFGHHYASIAGLAPMLGPAIAVIWGWLPGMLWVVLGTLFIGAVHDFGAPSVTHANRFVEVPVAGSRDVTQNSTPLGFCITVHRSNVATRVAPSDSRCLTTDGTWAAARSR